MPCSIKTAAAVAHCVSDTLMARAADVTLKEGRPLILVVRETPLHLGHLRVLTALAEMGAVVLPPMPAFYNRPKQIDDLVVHTLARVLDRLGLPHTLAPEWQGAPAARAGAAPQLTAPAARPEPVAAALDLSIVVPVYNEEENLPLLWPEIREVLEPTGLRYEVIFVDDGSRDRSAEIVREFRERDARVRLVRLKANAGETAATDAGLNDGARPPRGRHGRRSPERPPRHSRDAPAARPVGRGDRLAREPGRRRLVGAPALVAHRQPGAQPAERRRPSRTAGAPSGPSAASACAISCSTRGSIGSFRRFSGCAASGCSRCR